MTLHAAARDVFALLLVVMKDDFDL